MRIYRVRVVTFRRRLEQLES